MLRWKRHESRRPSPVGIVMDSDDDVSVASTPVRLQDTELLTGNTAHRKTKSFDDCSILESVCEIALADQDCSNPISPIEIPRLGKGMPPHAKALQKHRPMASLPLMRYEAPSRKGKNASPDVPAQEPTPFTWVRRGKPSVSPESPTMKRSSSQTQFVRPLLVEPRMNFWNRSPIAKGVKDAIWSAKRAGTPTKSEPIVKTNGGLATPTRDDTIKKPVRRGTSFNCPAPTTPTRKEAETRRGSLNWQASTPTRADVSLVKKSSNNLPPATPTGSTDVAPRPSSTPTRLETLARRVSTPTKGDQKPRRSSSPSVLPKRMHSKDSQSDGFRSLRSRSESSDESTDNEIEFFEFRAPRFGKLGLVINSAPQTGPMVEQVKDYSTLFGRIHAGDKIVEVDGVETSHMTIKEVTKRLAGKYGLRAAPIEVRIKVSRVREREWHDAQEEEPAMHSARSIESFSSNHRRMHSDPEPLLNRLSFNSTGEHQRLSSYSYSNHSKSGEEV